MNKMTKSTVRPKVAWIIPPLLFGSGGIINMFNKAQVLTHAGFECHFYIEPAKSFNDYTDDILNETIEKYYGNFDITYHSGFEFVEKYDLLIATMFYSTFIARDSGQTCPIIYFNQDYEAQFHAMGDGYIFGENSYRHAAYAITSGRWLTHMCGVEFGVQSQPIEIVADLSIYRRLDHVVSQDAVCFIYQPEKFRRCPQLGIGALEIVKRRRPQTTVYFFGSSKKFDVNFECVNLGMLPGPKDINEVYNRCRVGLCISATNPSRVPFEMAAAGLPVVDLYRYNNLLDAPPGATLAYQSSESIADAILSILEHEEKWRELSTAGVEAMQVRGIDREHALFAAAVSRIYAGLPCAFLNQPLAYEAAPFVSEREPSRQGAIRFCEHQRAMAARKLPQRPTIRMPTSAEGTILTRVVPGESSFPFAGGARANFHDVQSWGEVPKLGYSILANLNLYEYTIEDGDLAPRTIRRLRCRTDSATPLVAANQAQAERVVASQRLSIEQLEDAVVRAIPKEWSGVNFDLEYLVLHPNGSQPSTADLVGAVPPKTAIVVARVALINANSPDVEFALGISGIVDAGLIRKDRAEFLCMPFVRLSAGEHVEIQFVLPQIINVHNSLRLLTRHPPDIDVIEYSHAGWLDIGFVLAETVAATIVAE